MPPRLVSLAILVYWSVAAFFLLTWEVLPELSLGYPPDLQAIASAGDDGKPVTWAIDVIDDPRRPEVRRAVGQAVTESKKLPDRWIEMTSKVVFDAGELLKKTPLASSQSVRLSLGSVYRVDPSGNLQGFDMKVSTVESDEVLFKVEGRLHKDIMKVTAKGVAAVFNQSFSFRYEPRGVVYDALRPLDRLPGLHVGQRWEMQMVNPLSGAVETARVEVKRRTLIDWNSEAVSAFEVEQHVGPMTAKTWVRVDGLILRQEVPLPFVNMVLERMPGEPTGKPDSEAESEGAL